MPLPDNWAKAEDFATLFQYFWYRDFPMHRSATGARRSDWTIHIGLVVRSIADLMGLVTRFESGKRKDAVLRSGEGDEIAIEWEWNGAWGNELKKLKEHRTWSPDRVSNRLLQYAVLVTYTHTPNIGRVYDHVRNEWHGAQWPLLLVLIDLEESKKFVSRKDFKHINMSMFYKDRQRILRDAPAFPWNVGSSRWSVQTV